VIATLNVDADTLRLLVEQVVILALERLTAAQAKLPDQLAYGEAEASRLLDLARHHLRDERLRGRIEFSRIVGNRVAYTSEALVAYLARGNSTG
jgi:hypothetical protein